ncbi:hypothetical protein BJ322DRAFT_1158528 [Thelephora terrestris]|uniref:Uncharacterized protein n=1 Tax=Thelephora terrestris TaxID=56493 RepID=A0A9P6HDH0_9AGAM|nr:hypothetical protein BJ322DRAFT_1158528 [Thelephora terrestris]
MMKIAGYSGGIVAAHKSGGTPGVLRYQNQWATAPEDYSLRDEWRDQEQKRARVEIEKTGRVGDYLNAQGRLPCTKIGVVLVDGDDDPTRLNVEGEAEASSRVATGRRSDPITKLGLTEYAQISGGLEINTDGNREVQGRSGVQVIREGQKCEMDRLSSPNVSPVPPSVHNQSGGIVNQIRCRPSGGESSYQRQATEGRWGKGFDEGAGVWKEIGGGRQVLGDERRSVTPGERFWNRYTLEGGPKNDGEFVGRLEQIQKRINEAISNPDSEGWPPATKRL